MKIIICGATGFVGRNLVPALLNENHQLTLVGRNIDKIQRIFMQGISCLTWDELDKLSPDDFDAIINLAGETIAQMRWSKATKQKIKDSRIKATQQIAQWCMKASTKRPHLYNASAIGIYGLQSPQEELPVPYTESRHASFDNTSDFLSEVGRSWEASADALLTSHHPVTFMRFAVVLKRGEGILKKLELPFSLGLGSVLGNGKQAFTWIDIDDLIKAIIFLLNHPEIIGPINLCAPHCVSQATFAKTLASTMHRPLVFTMPTVMIHLLMGEMGKELLLGSQNIYPERLNQLGFTFLYPELTDALKHEWER